MTVKIVPASYSHIPTLARRMREADVEEVRAASGRSPLEALRRGLKMSEECYVALVDGRPEVMFGFGHDYNRYVGSAWMLGTDWMDTPQARMPIWRYSKYFVDRALKRYRIIGNYVDNRNTKSCRWLERLGFVALGTIQEYGVARIPFTLYIKEAVPCVSPSRLG